MPLACVTKIVSGGQTGADRGGLDYAIDNAMEHGGWCPRGRKAKDGTIPVRYKLEEASREDYSYRTKLNVRDSDGTVVFTTNPPGRGSSLTIQSCLDLGKPYLVLTQEQTIIQAAFHLLGFVRRNDVKTLNVAGSRAPEFYHWVILVLKRAAAESKDRVWTKEESPLGEDPKRFLKEVVSGIGESKTGPGVEYIDFQDEQGLNCKLQCHNAERLYIIPEAGRTAITQAQAKRLAHTLERWASAGDLGKGVGELERDY